MENRLLFLASVFYRDNWGRVKLAPFPVILLGGEHFLSKALLVGQRQAQMKRGRKSPLLSFNFTLPPKCFAYLIWLDVKVLRSRNQLSLEAVKKQSLRVIFHWFLSVGVMKLR